MSVAARERCHEVRPEHLGDVETVLGTLHRCVEVPARQADAGVDDRGRRRRLDVAALVDLELCRPHARVGVVELTDRHERSRQCQVGMQGAHLPGEPPRAPHRRVQQSERIGDTPFAPRDQTERGDGRRQSVVISRWVAAAKDAFRDRARSFEVVLRQQLVQVWGVLRAQAVALGLQPHAGHGRFHNVCCTPRIRRYTS